MGVALRTQPTGGSDQDYYLRQLRDWTLSAVIEPMSPRSMDLSVRLCGWTLARARPCRRPNRDIGVPRQPAKFDDAIADFAETYVDQNERDHASLAAAVVDGRVAAESGV